MARKMSPKEFFSFAEDKNEDRPQTDQIGDGIYFIVDDSSILMLSDKALKNQ